MSVRRNLQRHRRNRRRHRLWLERTFWDRNVRRIGRFMFDSLKLEINIERLYGYDFEAHQ